MKYPEIKVTIPEPCHEDWNKMTPTQKGKFCGVCTKEVIDFSAKSDEEIVKHAVTNNNLCGRFHPTQLDRKLIVDRKKRNHWLSYAATLLLPITLFSQETKNTVQKITQTEQTNNKDFKSLNIGSLQRQGKIAHVVQNDRITVKGVVTDDTGLPLPGATVLIKGTNQGKTTDFHGKYTIQAKNKDVLVISYVGFEKQEVTISANTSVYNIILQENYSIVGAVVVGCIADYNPDDYYKKPMTKGEIIEKKERTKNYFEFQKKKWREKRERKRAERAKRRADRKAKKESN